MSEDDRRRWDERYAPEELVMGSGPNALAESFAGVLPATGRALELACGEGQLAIWLAERGLEVDAVDVSPRGLEKLRRQARAAGVENRIRVVEHDLDRGLPPFEAGYALVTCFHFHAPGLFPAIRELLAPGGMLLVEVLSRVGTHLDTCTERIRAPRGELLRLAGDLAVHFYGEGVIRGKGLAQLLAQRPPLDDVEHA